MFDSNLHEPWLPDYGYGWLWFWLPKNWRPKGQVNLNKGEIDLQNNSPLASSSSFIIFDQEIEKIPVVLKTAFLGFRFCFPRLHFIAFFYILWLYLYILKILLLNVFFFFQKSFYPCQWTPIELFYHNL